MDTKLLEEMIRQLRQDLAHIQRAIRALEAIAKGTRPRGRPPKWLSGGKAQKPE